MQLHVQTHNVNSSFTYPVASLSSKLLQSYLFQDRKWFFHIGFICFFLCLPFCWEFVVLTLMCQHRYLIIRSQSLFTRDDRNLITLRIRLRLKCCYCICLIFCCGFWFRSLYKKWKHFLVKVISFLLYSLYLKSFISSELSKIL